MSGQEKPIPQKPAPSAAPPVTPKPARPPSPASPQAPPFLPPSRRPLPPVPARMKEMVDRVKQRFADATVDYVREKRFKLTVPPERIKEVAYFIRGELRFDPLSCVSGTDYIAKNEIIYFVGSLSRPGYEDVIIALAERPKRDNPVVQSLVEVWTGAEHQERETYEMLGVNFQGHPDLRKILLPEDWNDLPPLRKDYNSPGR